MKFNEIICLREPQPCENFTSLFRFMWDHGVGNTLDRAGNPTPWTDVSLESAFDSLKTSVDKRTIQNWLSGKNIPTRRNLYLLSRIASGDDEVLKQKWSDALIAARAQAKRAAPILVKRANEEKAIEDKTKNISVPSEVIAQPSGVKSHSAKPIRSPKSLMRLAALTAITLLVLSFIIYGLDGDKSPNKSVGNIMEKTIAVLPFTDLSAAQDQSFFSYGISEEIINALAQLSEFSVKSKTASFAFRESVEPIDEIAAKLGVNYFVEGSFRKNGDNFRLIARLVRTLDGELIWSKTYDEKSFGIFSAQEDIAIKITEALDIYLDDERRLAMFSFGTRDVEAYEHYLRGRYLLKGWHDSYVDQDLIKANFEFREAVESDPQFAKAYFHNVDVYYHLAKGDLAKKEAFALSGSAPEARDQISHLLDLAQKHAMNDTDRAQYRVNQIFFSDDWTGLRQAAGEFATLAINGRGELEWEFGPVILLLTGQTQLMLDLADKRILKYDPLNGTGHSYAVRAHLLNGDYEAAQARLSQAEATTFSNRLDEVKGYLLFSQGKFEELKFHALSGDNLSPLLQEYFAILANSDEAENLMPTAQHLKQDEIHHSLALLHTGHNNKAQNEIDEILTQPLGTVLFPVILAYGAGCGHTQLPKNNRLAQRMREADIKSIPCIGAQR